MNSLERASRSSSLTKQDHLTGSVLGDIDCHSSEFREVTRQKWWARQRHVTQFSNQTGRFSFNFLAAFLYDDNMPTRYRPAVYSITNIATGRVYIGQSLDYRSRWTRHVSDLSRSLHLNEHLQRSWDKHGRDAFAFKLEVDLSHLPRAIVKAVMNEAEKSVLAQYTKIYNIRDGGTSGLMPENSKKKMSAISKARMEDPATKTAWLEGVRRSHADPDVKARRLKAVAAGNRTPEARAKRSEISKSLWADPGFKLKNSKAIKAGWNQPEKREAARVRMKVRCAFPEEKAARIERWQDPDYRAIMTASHKARWQDPQYRELQMAKRAERWRKYWEQKLSSAP